LGSAWPILTADRFPFLPPVLDGGVLIMEPRKSSFPHATQGGSSERWESAASSGRSVRSSRPARQYLTSPAARLLRNAPGCAPNSATIVIEQIARYNPEAAVRVGIPFGHMRPQRIIPPRRHHHG
jgi:hypothetical protein